MPSVSFSYQPDSQATSLFHVYRVPWIHARLEAWNRNCLKMASGRNLKFDKVLVIAGAIASINIVSILGTSFLNLNEKTKYKLILIQALLATQSIMFFSARYLWIRLCSPLYSHPSNVNRVLFAFLISVITSAQGSIVLGMIFSGVEPHWISVVSYTCLGLLIIWTTATVIFDVSTWILSVLNVRFGSITSRAQYTRSQIMAIFIVSNALAVLALYNGHKYPVVKKVTIPLRNLAPELNGFTIVHLPDLHIGPTVGKTMLERAVRTTNQLNADVIAVTGDLVDATVYQLRQAVKPLLKLKARYGVYFVTGTSNIKCNSLK